LPLHFSKEKNMQEEGCTQMASSGANVVAWYLWYTVTEDLKAMERLGLLKRPKALTPEWFKARGLCCFTASEMPDLLFNCGYHSKFNTIQVKAGGIERKFSAFQQQLMDKGRVEEVLIKDFLKRSMKTFLEQNLPQYSLKNLEFFWIVLNPPKKHQHGELTNNFLSPTELALIC
jgi:hypothetical protein